MKLEELNKEQKKIMSNTLLKNRYEWEDIGLESVIKGELPFEIEKHRFSGMELSSEEEEQNQIIEKINTIIRKYNSNLKMDSSDLNELEQEYKNLEKYRKRTYTSYNSIIEAMKFNKVILISGPGGIGKSQFLFEFSEHLKNKYNYLCIYGKHCEKIDNEVFKQLEKCTKSSRFFLIVDAINEFSEELREKIYKFITTNKNNSNLRVIMSLRDYSLSEEDNLKLKKIIDYEETFLGVDTEDALKKISERNNLDLTIYGRLISDKNPLHLKMIINSINNNQLMNSSIKPLEKGTYLYEHFIKKTLSKTEWNTTKEIVKMMIDNNSKRLRLTDLNKLNVANINSYILKMKMKEFVGTFEFQSDTFLYYTNETLLDYLIARCVFEKIDGMELHDVKEYIDKIIREFKSVHHQIILMLFEKYDKSIKKALKIIKRSSLKYYMNYEIFNELSISKGNSKIVQKNYKEKISIEELFVQAGGNENNPFNCTRYLNDKLNKISGKKSLLMDIDSNEKIKNKLKSYVQTIGKFEYDNTYLEEKLWFAIWCSSLVNKTNRELAKKLIFEIVNEHSEYIDLLITLFDSVHDEYIEEMIVQVLGSLKRNNPTIIKFFNRIDTNDFCNIKNLYFISKYLYGKEHYEKMKKIDFTLETDKRINNKIKAFLRRLFFIREYEYDFFDFKIYDSSFSFNKKILNEKKETIMKINSYIDEEYKCVNTNECHSNFFKELIVNKKFDVGESLVDDKTIYLAWQKIFKDGLKKYGIKIKELEKIPIYDYDGDDNIIYKIVELSFSKMNGSIACNYYTNEFELTGKNKGYQCNYYDEYNEKGELYYPIAVFNTNIENLDNRIIKRISIPEKKNISWVKDGKLSLNNLKSIIMPIKYNNEEYYVIYAYVRLDEKTDNEFGCKWIDTYIVNLSIDDNYNLCMAGGVDRKHTIETDEYNGNIGDYERENYKSASSFRHLNGLDNVLITTDFKLPPSIIINEYNLHYDRMQSSWINNKGETVVLVNNNESKWFKKGCSGTLYIRKKEYDELKKNHNFKYFGFTEKFHPKTGYCKDSALQVQINSDGSIITYKHYKKYDNSLKTNNTSECNNCIVYKEQKRAEKKWKNGCFINVKILDEYSNNDDVLIEDNC